MNKKIGILLMILALLLTSAFDLIYTPEENNDPGISYTDPAGSGEGWTPDYTEPVYPGEDQLPSDQPPADQPPADQPPADQPPADQPLSDQPPADQPPAVQPPQWVGLDEDQVNILYNL